MVVLIVMYDLQLEGRDPGTPFQTDIGVHSVQFYYLCLGGHNASGPTIFFDVLHYNKHLLQFKILCLQQVSTFQFFI